LKNRGEKMAQAQTTCPESIEDLKNRDILTVKELLCSSIWGELSHSQRTMIKFLQHLKSVIYRRTIKIYKEAKYLKVSTYKSVFEIKEKTMLFRRINALGETLVDVAVVDLEKINFIIDFIIDFINSLLSDKEKEIVIPRDVLFDYLT